MRSVNTLLTLLLMAVIAVGCGSPQSAPAPQASAPVQAPAIVEVPSEEATPVGEEEIVVEKAAEVEEESAAEKEEEPGEEEAVQEEPAPVAAAVEGGTPKLVVPEPEYNFGQMDNSETVRHGFLIRNEGDGVLKIENVRASCGCTTTELEKKELQPGEEVSIQANTNLRGRQGPQTKAVTLFTNDPENPSYRLTMKGEAIASISIDPMNVGFGRIEDDDAREETVTIKSNKEDVEFTIRSVEADNMKFIKHELKEVTPGKEYQLLIRTEPALPEGHHTGRIIIRTDSTERPVIWMSVSMQVIGAIQIMPPVVNLRYTDEEGALENQQLSLTKGRVSTFEINEVVLPLDSMEFDLNNPAPNVYRLMLKNMPRNDDLEGKQVVLKTNIPEHPEVYIPFNIYKPKVKSVPPKKVTEAAKAVAATLEKDEEESEEAAEE
ncbi:MAG: DUF1573 domain-containing protein [Candidatus Hydrogenedens sp.]|jgi:hypothetical protein|nr:DUF1573 domain-containing protein [Candidatus Hydrogenedens sp.]